MVEAYQWFMSHELMSRAPPVVGFPSNKIQLRRRQMDQTCCCAFPRRQIYLMSTRSGSGNRFTTGRAGIALPSCLQPDGAWIYFTSDRGES